jgi:hypothetical protein
MWFMQGKVYSSLKEFREKMQSPESFRKAEKLATQSKEAANGCSEWLSAWKVGAKPGQR